MKPGMAQTKRGETQAEWETWCVCMYVCSFVFLFGGELLDLLGWLDCGGVGLDGLVGRKISVKMV